MILRIVSITLTLGVCWLFQPNLPAEDRQQVILKEGEAIPLRLVRSLSSKTARLHDPIDFELARDLRVNDLPVAREGTRAKGDVTLVEKAGMMGKGGDLAIRLSELVVGDTRIKLRGTQGKGGDSKYGTTVALTLAFGFFGMMKHGKNAELPAGSPITAYVAEDVAISVLSIPTPVFVSASPAQKPAAEPSSGSKKQQSQTGLDAAALLQMKAGGLSDNLILSMASKRGLGTMTPEDLIKLKNAGMSDATLGKLVELGVSP